jgi:predicted RNA-binding protein associated with RNAse of E/G family
MQPAIIHYIRPGKGVTIYAEDLIAENAAGIKTFKTLPHEAAERLNRALLEQGLIHPDQSVLTIGKVYFFNEPFNILEFRAPDGSLLGHYSDIGEPLIKRGTGEFEMTDLFLDIWLLPNGQLVELDWDEFEEAIINRIITPVQADLARAAMQRLKDEITRGIYPNLYLQPENLLR